MKPNTFQQSYFYFIFIMSASVFIQVEVSTNFISTMKRANVVPRHATASFAPEVGVNLANPQKMIWDPPIVVTN